MEEVCDDEMLISDSDLTEACGYDLVVGRAIFTTDNLDYFRKSSNNNNNNNNNYKYQARSTGREISTSSSWRSMPNENEEDDSTNFHMWFIELFDLYNLPATKPSSQKLKDVRSQLIKHMRIAKFTGAIALEAVYNHRLQDTNTTMLGVLFFNCSLERAYSIIREGKFSTDNLANGECVLEWLSRTEYVGGFQTSETRQNSIINALVRENNRWTEIFIGIVAKCADASRRKRNRTLDRLSKCKISVGGFTVQTYILGGILGKWAFRDGMKSVDNTILKPVLWLYFHYRLRFNCKLYMHYTQFISALAYVNLDFVSPRRSNYNDFPENGTGNFYSSGQDGLDEYMSGSSSSSDDDFDEGKARVKAGRGRGSIKISFSDINRKPMSFVTKMASFAVDNHFHLQTMIHQFMNLLQIKIDCEHYFIATVKCAKDEAKQQLKATQIFMLRTLEDVTEQITDNIPSNLFDVPAMNKWCEDSRDEIVKRTNVETVLETIFEKMSCVEVDGSGCYPRGYGTSKRVMQDIRYHLARRSVGCDTAGARGDDINDSMKIARVVDVETSVRKNEQWCARKYTEKYQLESNNLSAMQLDSDTQRTQLRHTLANSVTNNNLREIDYMKTAMKIAMSSEYKHKRLRGTNSTTHYTYLRSALRGTPIWRHVEKGWSPAGCDSLMHIYHSLTVIDERDEMENVAYHTLDECMDKYVYPKDCATLASSEMITPLLHVKNIILDCDLHSSQVLHVNQLPVKELQEMLPLVYKEMVDIAEYACLRRLGLEETATVNHYILRSDKDHTVSDSIGLRHIIALPENVTVSTLLVSQLHLMFNTIRHFKPKLKLFGGTNDRNFVYDTAIYGSDGRACHDLRGAYQSKVLGEFNAVLKPVYFASWRGGKQTKCTTVDRDTFVIPYLHRFVHGIMDDNRPRPLQGILTRHIDKFVDIQPLEDEDHLRAVERSITHRFTRGKCATKIDGIMQEVDKMFLLSSPKMHPLDRVRDIVVGINELWEAQKEIWVSYMTSSNYSEDEIECTKNDLEYQLVDGRQIMLVNFNTGSKNVRLCLYEPHPKKASSYLTAAVCGTSMQITMFCKCFKSSCENKVTAFDPFTLRMEDDVFRFPFVRERFVSRLATPMTEAYYENGLEMCYVQDEVFDLGSGGDNNVDDRTHSAYRLSCVGSGVKDMHFKSERSVLMTKYVGKIHEFLHSTPQKKSGQILNLYTLCMYDESSRVEISVFRTSQQLYVLYVPKQASDMDDSDEDDDNGCLGGAGDDENRYVFQLNRMMRERRKRTRQRQRQRGKRIIGRLIFTKNAYYIYCMLGGDRHNDADDSEPTSRDTKTTTNITHNKSDGEKRYQLNTSKEFLTRLSTILELDGAL